MFFRRRLTTIEGAGDALMSCAVLPVRQVYELTQELEHAKEALVEKDGHAEMAAKEHGGICRRRRVDSGCP